MKKYEDARKNFRLQGSDRLGRLNRRGRRMHKRTIQRRVLIGELVLVAIILATCRIMGVVDNTLRAKYAKEQEEKKIVQRQAIDYIALQYASGSNRNYVFPEEIREVTQRNFENIRLVYISTNDYYYSGRIDEYTPDKIESFWDFYESLSI